MFRRIHCGVREALFCAFFAGGFLMATWITRTPQIREALDLSLAEMGFVLFGLSAGSILALILAPMLIPRFGARLVTIAGECIALTGLLLGALTLASRTAAYPGLCFAFSLGLIGFGFVFLDVAVNVAGGVLEAVRSKPVLTSLHGSFSTGEAAGALAGCAMTACSIPPAAHFVLAAAGTALLFLLSGMKLGEVSELVAASQHEPKASDGSRSGIALTPSLMIALTVVFIAALCEGAANDWLPVLIRETMDASPSFSAFAFAVFASVLSIVRFSGSFWLTRFGSRRVLEGSAALAILGLALIILSSHPMMSIAGVACWAAGAALGFPVSLSTGAQMEAGDLWSIKSI